MGCMEQKKTAIAACERELRKKRKEIRDAHEEREGEPVRDAEADPATMM